MKAESQKCSNGLKITDGYLHNNRKKIRCILFCTCLLVGLATFAAFEGTAELTLFRFLARVVPSLGNVLRAVPLSDTEMTIFLQLRGPRIVMAVLVGAGLGVCGTVMQATTGNIMASPFTTGIASAAAFGAAVGIVFHPFGAGNVSTIVTAFLLAMMDSAVVYGITALTDIGAGAMILIGVALNFLFSSLNSLLQYVASEDELAQIVHWSFGSLTGITWIQNIIVLAGFTAAILVFMRYAWSFNIMESNGDEGAKALGVNTRRTRIVNGAMVTVVTAVTISFVGVIGFVGLVAPHIARLLTGGEHRTLLPMSALLGAILVLLADTVGRTIASPVIIPVGIILSAIGAPMFVYLILTRPRRDMI